MDAKPQILRAAYYLFIYLFWQKVILMVNHLEVRLFCFIVTEN